MIHKVYLQNSISDDYTLNCDGEYVVDQLERRPKYCTLNSSVEYFFDIKMNGLGLPYPFNLSKVLSFCQLDCFISFEVQFYVLL